MICDCNCGCEPDWVDPKHPWHAECACRSLGCPCTKETTMEVPDVLMNHLDGFLGLIVNRGDTDYGQARELLDRVTELTRRPKNPEIMYAIRRTDGEPIMGEFSYLTIAGPTDWGPAEDDAAYGEDSAEYELVKMTVDVIERRKLPRCAECDEVAEFWGLCEQHAREDDPETLDEVLAAREGS